jgi:hypothetical protein
VCIAGVLFVALSMVASLTNVQPPTYLAAEADIARWFAEEADRYRAGHVLAGLAFLFFYFPYFAGLYGRLREAEGTTPSWSRTSWAGAIISPAAGTAAGAFIVAAALLESEVSSGAGKFALAANFYAYTVSGAYAGVALTGAAVVILRTGVFPRWLGWFAAVPGLAAIAGTATLIENDPDGVLATISGLAWFGFFLWILAVSVFFLRPSRRSVLAPGS